LEVAMGDLQQKLGMLGVSSGCSDEARPTCDYEPAATGVSVVEPSSPGQEISTATEPLQERKINAVPMRTVMEVTTPQNASQRNKASSPGKRDLISAGQLGASEGDELFILFRDRMNQYLWGGVACPYDSLPPVRQSSCLLSTVVFTIAFLHLPEKEAQFDLCYKEYLSLVAEAMIARHHNLDDIRALVLGAFWLPDLSWKLSSLAVRIATELNLHHAFHQSSFEDEHIFHHARLWYLLYVCDRHFSITYGRPPMLNADSTISKCEMFLASRLCTPADHRLISQVDLFKSLEEAFHTFGADTSLPLEASDFQTLRRFTVKVENWRLDWEFHLGESELRCLLGLSVSLVARN
jgi:hypothetical protein